MRIVLIAVSVLALAVAGFTFYEQEPDAESIMLNKLDHAHGLLEALVFEDFEALEESGLALAALSEQAGWYVHQTSEYTQQSTAFQLAARSIADAATDREVARR